MGGYIALKPVNFGGVNYAEGSTVPEEAVLPSRVRILTAQKIIKAIGSAPATAQNGAESVPTVETIDLPIETENGSQTLSASAEDIIEMVTIMQNNADDAAELVGAVTSDNVLILLNACDSRSTVKKAAKARAAELEEEAKAAEGGD
jgi:hypothetical protein